MKLFWLRSRGDRQVMWARYDDGITVAGFRFLITVEAVDGVTPPAMLRGRPSPGAEKP